MSTYLYPCFYILVIIGAWLLCCCGITLYLNRQANQRAIRAKVMEWTARYNGKNCRGRA